MILLVGATRCHDALPRSSTNWVLCFRAVDGAEVHRIFFEQRFADVVAATRGAKAILFLAVRT
eukprot:663212-Lingulodinium_polyedra.AAC.1